MSKLRELSDAATPGPWVVRKARGDCFVQGNKVAGKTVAGEYFTEILSDESYAEKEADCELIAYQRNKADDIASLIDAAKECSLMRTGSIDECISKLHKLDAALANIDNSPSRKLDDAARRR